jgi:hypothetical protein
MSVAFAFSIGGRDVDPANIADPQEAEFLQGIVESVVDRIELMECGEHKEPPRFLCSGETIDELSLEVFGCCQALVDEVTERLNRV